MENEKTPDYTNLSFREILEKEFRSGNFTSVAEMGRSVGLNTEYLRQILNGTKPPPSDDLVCKLARFLWPSSLFSNLDAFLKPGMRKVYAKEVSKKLHHEFLLAAIIARNERNKEGAAELWKEIRSKMKLATREIRESFPERGLPIYDHFSKRDNYMDAFKSPPIEKFLVPSDLDEKNAFVIKMPDDSMEPSIPRGSYLIFLPFQGEIDSLLGKVYAFSIRGIENSMTIRTLDKSGVSDCLVRPFNKDFHKQCVEFKDIEIWGRLAWSLKDWNNP